MKMTGVAIAANPIEDLNMSIERTSPLKPVSSVQPRETSDVQTSKARTEKSEQATSSSVTLSDAQSKLMQPGSSDINQARVDAIKTAIKNAIVLIGRLI